MKFKNSAKMARILLTIVFFTFASLQTGPLVQVNADSATKLSVEPQYTFDVYPGETFSVDVNITNVFDLYGYEFMLVYDTNVLTATDLAPHSGTSNEPGFFFPTYTVWYHEINDDPWGNGTGYAWISVTLPMGTPQGLNGNGTLAKVQFSVEGYGFSLFDLTYTLLGTPTEPITDFDVFDGYFMNLPPPVASFTYSPLSPLVNENITFDASLSEGLITNYLWDFGDETNTSLTDPIAYHAYDTLGTYTVNLTVTDPANRTSSLSQSIKVTTVTLRITPEYGSIGTMVGITGIGFRPLAPVVLSFDDMQLGEILANEDGNFSATINVPLSEPGLHSIKAWYDNRTAYAEATFRVVNVTPLDVGVDVGEIHFRGEIAEFYALTSLNGERVDATIISAKIYFPNGTLCADLTGTQQNVVTGLFRIAFNIGGTAPPGSYTLVVDVTYVDEYVNSKGTSFATFLLSTTLSDWNATLISIDENVGTIKTDIDLMEVKLDTINATLAGLITTSKGEILARIESKAGNILARLDTINATVVGLITTNKGEILAKIEYYLGSAGVITAKLNEINATIVSVHDDIVTISTVVGTIDEDVSILKARVEAIDVNTVAVRTSLGNINGTITSIKGNVATILTDVGAIKAILQGWAGGATSTITTPQGTFKILTLTTSTLEGAPTISEHVITIIVSGETGKAGTLNIILPKQLLDNLGSTIETVSATINDNALPITHSELNGAYILRMSYTHSTHTIKIYLSGAPPTPLPLSTIIAIVIIFALSVSIVFYMLRRRRPQTIHNKPTVAQ